MALTRRAFKAVAVILLGWLLGAMAVHLNTLAVLFVLAAVALALLVLLPLRHLLVATVAISIALPKMGGYIHGVPLDAGVVCSVILVVRALIQNGFGEGIKFSRVHVMWFAWVVFELLRGLKGATSLGWFISESAVFTIPILLSWYIAQQDEETLGTVLKAVQISLGVLVAYTLLGVIVGQSHLTIHGITMEAGGGSSAYNLALRDNLTSNGTLKAAGTYQNGNLLGAALALLVPIFLVVHGNRSWKVWLLFLAGSAANVLTLSRGAWLGLMANIVVLGVVDRRFRSLLPLAGVMVVTLLSVHSLHGRAFHSLNNLSGRGPYLRLLWQALHKGSFVQQIGHWLMGWGLAAGPSIGGDVLYSIDISFPWMMISTGLIGLALYLTLVGKVFAHTLRASVTIRSTSLLLIGAMVCQMTDGQLFYTPTAWNFWIIAGLAMGLAKRSARDSEALEVDSGKVGRHSENTPGAWKQRLRLRGN